MRLPTSLTGYTPRPYREFLEAIFDLKNENYEQYVRWAGGHFIDEFDLKVVNETLCQMRWPVRHQR